MATTSGDDGALVFPDLSVAVAVKECVPPPSTLVVKVHLPDGLATVVPRTVAPSIMVTVARPAAVPVSDGVVSRVMSSLLRVPVSDEATRSGLDGVGTTTAARADGAVWPTLLLLLLWAGTTASVAVVTEMIEESSSWTAWTVAVFSPDSSRRLVVARRSIDEKYAALFCLPLVNSLIVRSPVRTN